MNSACSGCGAQLKAGAFLCPQCGVPAAKAPVVTEPKWGSLALPGRAPSTSKQPAVAPPTPAPATSRKPPPPPSRSGQSAQRTSLEHLDARGFVGGSTFDQERAANTMAYHGQSPGASFVDGGDDDLPAALGGFEAPLPAPPRSMPSPPRKPSRAPTMSAPLELDVPHEMAHRSLRQERGAAAAGSARLRGFSSDLNDAPLEREPPSEIAVIARYGEVPKGLVACAFYAVRVGLRRMELSNTVARLVSERARAAAEADRALITLGQVLYQQRHDPRLAVLAPELERVMTADQTIGERNAAHQDARWEVVDELATLDQVVADTGATIEPIREHETNLQRYLEQLQDNSKRTQARMQRVEIQIRALHAAEDMTEDPELLPTLEAERRVRDQEVRALAAQIAQVRQALGEARRELAAHLGTLEALHEDRQGRQRTLQQRDDIHKSYGGEAIDAMTYSLRLLAHAALNQGLFMLAESETRRAETAVQRLKDRDRDETLHQAALISYDIISFRKGVFALSAAFVLTLVALRLVRHLGGHF